EPQHAGDHDDHEHRHTDGERPGEREVVKHSGEEQQGSPIEQRGNLAEDARSRQRPQEANETHDDDRNTDPVQELVGRVLMTVAVFGQPLLDGAHLGHLPFPSPQPAPRGRRCLRMPTLAPARPDVQGSLSGNTRGGERNPSGGGPALSCAPRRTPCPQSPSLTPAPLPPSSIRSISITSAACSPTRSGWCRIPSRNSSTSRSCRSSASASSTSAFRPS